MKISNSFIMDEMVLSVKPFICDQGNLMDYVEYAM